jgi:site-specific DNA recombinase
MWMGGGVPLGYINRDKKLIIVPEEAETVRWIFRTYIEAGQLAAFSKKWTERTSGLSVGSQGTGEAPGAADLAPARSATYFGIASYVGEIAHKGLIHAGDHQPIIERELFEAVQVQLKSGAVDRKLKHAGTPYPLKGKLFDSVGNRMTP